MNPRFLRAAAGGVLLGAALVSALAHAAWLAPQPPSVAIVKAGPPPGSDLATQLMGRIARTFVHQKANDDGGVSFFEPPTPYGDLLCRVREHAFAGRVAMNRMSDRMGSPSEPLEVRDLYGVWREPGAPEGQGRDAACAAWRDFDGLISGDDSGAIDRAVYVVGMAARAARAGGPVPFKVTCVDRRKDSDHPRACDGVAILRALHARDIRFVTPLEDTWPDDPDDFDPKESSAVWRDQVQMKAASVGGGCGQSESLMFKITTLQVFGRHSASEGELQAIKIERDVIC